MSALLVCVCCFHYVLGMSHNGVGTTRSMGSENREKYREY